VFCVTCRVLGIELRPLRLCQMLVCDLVMSFVNLFMEFFWQLLCILVLIYIPRIDNLNLKIGHKFMFVGIVIK